MLLNYDVDRVEKIDTSETELVNLLLDHGWKILSIVQESIDGSWTVQGFASSYFILGASKETAEKYPIKKSKDELEKLIEKKYGF